MTLVIICFVLGLKTLGLGVCMTLADILSMYQPLSLELHHTRRSTPSTKQSSNMPWLGATAMHGAMRHNHGLGEAAILNKYKERRSLILHLLNKLNKSIKGIFKHKGIGTSQIANSQQKCPKRQKSRVSEV